MSDKTYSEACGKPAFDWNLFLDRAERGEVDSSEWKKARVLARSWVTCACGNQCERIPRTEEGMPEDFDLRAMGGMFLDYITDKDAPSCRIVLHRIESRSAVLIA